jgi:hypothetical protein
MASLLHCSAVRLQRCGQHADATFTHRRSGEHIGSPDDLQHPFWVDEDGILRSGATARPHSRPVWLGWTLKDGCGWWQLEEGDRTGRASQGAKRGRGAPYARLVCLVFVSRASNSMLQLGKSKRLWYCPPRTSFSAAACSRPARDRLTHQRGMLLRATRSRLEPTGPAGRAAQRGRTALCPFRKDTSLFKRTHGNLRLPSHTMNTCRNANYPERTLSSLPDRSVSVPRSVCSQTLQQHMCMVHAHVHVHVHAHCAG